eukprot:TRINITY_DN60941_c0_g1_i1.p1 TRINITY_DN60941_c0_g1~~TRINITY_DN60941_c0_g1_i1.p1  ORF type:complete len:579 (+),score=185.04 TRINITY_DN60941_c0_g1_i1:72-1739(+)
MRGGAAVALLLALCGEGASAADSRKPVLSLPGYGAPKTKHWSGFVEVDAAAGSNLFYYLVEAEGDASKKPLLWWMQGGPGASSMVGMFSELGPVLLNSSNSLIDNPYSWHQEANLLVVEFAEGIGYSYCANSSRDDLPCKQSSGMCSPCLSSDDLVVEHNVAFFDGFLKLFPEFAGRPLYLAGESYAGVYVPTFAQALLRKQRSSAGIDLRGLWVTDPCTDNKAQAGWLDWGVDFAYQKGFLAKSVRDTLVGPGSKCLSGRHPAGDPIRVVDSPDCRRAWRLYDIATAGIGSAIHPQPVPGLPLYYDPLNAIGLAGEPDLQSYLGRPDVRTAINADQSANKHYHLALDNNGYDGYTVQYDACNDYPQRNASMVDVYRSILSLSPGTRFGTIIISSGDVDPVVALHGTEAAVLRTFGAPQGAAADCDRRPWWYNATGTPLEVLRDKPLQWGRALHSHDAGPQVAGFTRGLPTAAGGPSAHWVTFRDSGHMVPGYAPIKALHVLRKALLAAPDTAPLSPCLPKGWDSGSDAAFYARSGTQPGLFADWVAQASRAPYV